MVSSFVLVLIAGAILFFLSQSQTGGDGGGDGGQQQAPTADFSFTPTNPVSGESVSFDGTLSSDPDGTITAWDWDFGDGTTGTGSTTTHTYSSAGDFTVTLTVTDDAGATDTVSMTITVDATPIADFNWSPIPPTAGEAAEFNGTLSSDPDGSITSYEWDFGDGSTGTGDTILHTFSSGGDYTVTLTVTDSDGLTDSVSMTVSVNSPPDAVFSWSPDPALVGESITFDGGLSADPDGSIQTYSWDFDDGSTGTGSLATHSYTAAGEYAVTLTVTDDDGATNSVTNTVTVGEPPTADFTYSPQDPLAGETIQFDGTLSSDPDGTIQSYAWDFGDGTTGSGATPTHSYDFAGDYTVVLTVTDDDGFTDTVSQVVSVFAEPTADFTFTPSDPLVGETIEFDGRSSSDPDGSILNYAWDFGDGTTGSGDVVTHSYSAAGDYVVTLTVTDDTGFTDSQSQTVTVTDTNTAPTASFTFSPTSPNAGETVTFDGSGSSDPDGTIQSWFWNFGDGNTGTGEVTSHTYLEGGTYTVTLTVTDNDGATDSANDEITVQSSGF